MATVQNMDEMGGDNGRYRAGDHPVGQRLSRWCDEAAARIHRWVVNIRREWVCHAAAATFCILVVIPAVMIFGDRRLPFEIGHVFFKPTETRPGDTIVLNYTLTRVAKECDGEVHQRMFDGNSHIWDLGVIPAVYADRGDKQDTPSFHRDKKVPDGFGSGPALYKARVLYWCNPLQRLYPLELVVEAPFTVD